MSDLLANKKISPIPAAERRKIAAVLRLFRESDRCSRQLRSVTGLGCISGCGRCCEDPNVQTTILEMLPLAAEYFAEHKERLLREGFAYDPMEDFCRFYRADPAIKGNGRCSEYARRPLVCRLFGFSVRLNKHNQPDLITCGRIKETFPADYQKTQAMLAQGLPAPKMSDYSMRLLAIDPTLGAERIPINLAFHKALERIAFLHELSLKT